MIVVRFRVHCQPEKVEEVQAAMAAVVAPSRALDGVVSFDIGRDVTDSNVLIATEVFESREALDRQEQLAEVAKVMELLPDALAEPPEATIYDVSSSEPYA